MCDQLMREIQNILFVKVVVALTWSWIELLGSRIMASNYFNKLSLTIPQCFTLMPIKSLITLYKALLMSDQDLRIFG